MTTAVAANAFETVQDHRRCEGAVVRVGAAGAAALQGQPIRCRPKRRLGQHVVGGDEAVGLDTYLARAKSQGTNQRYVVAAFDGCDGAMLECLARHTESCVAIRLCECTRLSDAGSLWMVDADQLAALLGVGWQRGGDPTVVRACCGDWIYRVYTLTPPRMKGSRLEGDEIRKALSGFARYGDAGRDGLQLAPNEYVARPSKGAGSGHPGIEVTKEQFEELQELDGRLGDGSWVCVERSFSSAVGPKGLSVPATLRVRPDNSIGQGHIGVDQVIRLALGVAEWETVSVRLFDHEQSVSSRGPEYARRLRKPSRRDQRAHRLAPAVHVVGRVQPAELTLTEQRACLLSKLALDSLGLKSGDEVLLHAVATLAAETDPQDGEGEVTKRVHTKLRVKAYEAPKEVIDRRMTTYGGGRGAPLPSEESAFQFSQALPWVWVDAAIRERMGLPPQLGAVVVAPSRWFIIKDNFREVALVVALALTSAAIRAEGEARWVLGVLAAIIPVMLIGSRIRTRLR